MRTCQLQMNLEAVSEMKRSESAISHSAPCASSTCFMAMAQELCPAPVLQLRMSVRISPSLPCCGAPAAFAGAGGYSAE